LLVSTGWESQHLVSPHKVVEFWKVQAAVACSYSFQMQRISELRISATLGKEPEIELSLP
jgi:hypothetical protein